MLRSMTGFGLGEAAHAERRVTVQLKSVNSRFLEVGLKLPPDLWPREAEVRRMLQEAVGRGKVDVQWSESAPGGAQAVLPLDAARARAWAGALTDLARDLGLPAGPALGDVLRMPGVLAAPETEPQGAADPDARWGALRQALESALKGLDESRLREGAALGRELEGLLAEAEAGVGAVERRSLEVQDGFALRLRKRLGAVLESLGPDDPRVAMEAALAVDRADIREELVRFRTHAAEFRRLLDGREPVGKRLDFLCQELLREANTMGSKSPDAALTQAVVSLKSVVERLKEQALNVA